MEQQEQTIERLNDYKDLFNDHITGKDVKYIAEQLQCAKSTVYTYMNGGVPETDKAKKLEQEILKLAKEILIERGNLLIEKLK